MIESNVIDEAHIVFTTVNGSAHPSLEHTVGPVNPVEIPSLVIALFALDIDLFDYVVLVSMHFLAIPRTSSLSLTFHLQACSPHFSYIATF